MTVDERRALPFMHPGRADVIEWTKGTLLTEYARHLPPELFDRFLDDRDRELVWHPHKGTLAPRSVSSAIWHTFPLDAPAPGGNRRPDVTFRLGLIARLSGRPIELV